MNCPDCGFSAVTVDTTPPHNPTETLSSVVKQLEKGATAGEMRWCSICGWTETRRVRLEEIEVEHGDAAVIETAQLRQEIRETADGIESPPALKDALAEINRIRRLNQNTTSDEE